MIKSILFATITFFGLGVATNLPVMRQEQWLLNQYKSDLGLNPQQVQKEKDKLDKLTPEELDTLVADYKAEKQQAENNPGKYNYRVYLRDKLVNQSVTFSNYAYWWPNYPYIVPSYRPAVYIPRYYGRPAYRPTYHSVYHPTYRGATVRTSHGRRR